ncbi:site-specific integrase [Streptococcus canis]|uniref:tyrosine-type recombinase/integrase n=1 Tax=Streptococcus canis TaxID=1329 RepID=UPI00294A4D1E|nr:site-specific integrase [Streptococcus canis]MDV5987576.1 site-specific integrase [Streptococcus canis]
MATYRQRGKKKTWDFRVFDEKGHLIASGSGFKTKREAVYEAQEIEKKKSLNGVFSVNVSLYELWFEWYKLVIEPSNLSISTKKKYFARGTFIKKYFIDKKVSKIKHSEYQQILNEYGKFYTKNHVRRLNSDIRKSIQLAMRDGVLINDFTVGVEITGKQYVKETEDKYLHSISDYKKVVNYLEKNLDYSNSVILYLLLLLFKTGLRVGEALALTWEDIDFEKMELQTYRRFSGDKGVFTLPKTKTSIRSIPLSQSTCEVLSSLKKVQSYYLKTREIKNYNNQIFFDYRYGVPTNSAINKNLRKILKLLSINSNMTSTGCRHTYGSYLLSQGIDIWVVSKLMGHKDITQLVETYGHVLTEVINKEFENIRTYLS